MQRLEINDIVKVVFFNEKRFFQLEDIAVWKIGKEVRGIQMTELKDLVKWESAMKLKNGDRFIIQPSSKTIENNAIYQVTVKGGWIPERKKKIGSIHFQKMMTT